MDFLLINYVCENHIIRYIYLYAKVHEIIIIKVNSVVYEMLTRLKQKHIEKIEIKV